VIPKKSFRCNLFGLILSIIILVGCSGLSQDQAEVANTPTDTYIPPAETLPPSTSTVAPPTATVTPIPTTATPTNIPADQGPITCGEYEFQFNTSWILEGNSISVDGIYGVGDSIFMALEPDPNARTLFIELQLLSGDRESFYEYRFLIMDEDSRLLEIKTIFTHETKIMWIIPELPSSSSFVVLCPKGEKIDLTPIMEDRQ